MGPYFYKIWHTNLSHREEKIKWEWKKHSWINKGGRVSKFWWKTYLSIQEVHWTPNHVPKKKTKPRLFIDKLLKNKKKEKILKTNREKSTHYKQGINDVNNWNFSTETMNARKQWNNICKEMTKNNFKPQNFEPIKNLLNKSKTNINIFSSKIKLRFITNETVPKKWKKKCTIEASLG